jgi:TrmH family RNA methyltransferase
MELITSKENSCLKQAVKLLNNAKERREQRCFVAEGVRLCEDAVLSGVKIDRMFCTQHALEKYERALRAIAASAAQCYVVSPELMRSLCDTQSPQGIVCVCRMLDKSECMDKMEQGTHYLLLEQIQDPSNLGTILRTAEALGVDGVFMAGGCDIYSPKVLRGSMGAVFRLPFTLSNSLSDAIEALKTKGVQIYAAVPDASALPVTQVNFSVPSAVVVGNEGNGLQQRTVAQCSGRITIPMRGKAESLNAAMAAGILLWEMMRRRDE